jgi:hypothetical protein
VALSSKTGQLVVSQVKSTGACAGETLDAIHHEALMDIVQELRTNPSKILVVARIVHNPAYFTASVTASVKKDWIHSTIVKFQGVPKAEWILILIDFRTASKVQPPWTEDLLRLVDKHYKLRGIEYMVQYLGLFRMSDKLPPKCHFRPLLRTVMQAHFSDAVHAKTISINPKSGEVNFQAYVLTAKVEECYTKLRCIPRDVEVAIPDDYYVKHDAGWVFLANHSVSDARLKGKRVDINCAELFADTEDSSAFEYDKDHFLDAVVDSHYPAYQDVFEKDLLDMTVDEKPADI